MPWNQEIVNFTTNTSESRNLSATHLDFRPVMYSPQTPANTYTEPMDIEMEDVGTNSGVDLVGDGNMDGHLPYLSNEYILLC